MKRWHYVRYCKIRKVLVPRGILKWIPKFHKVSYDQTNTYGSKYFKGSSLGT